eukprot:scaffold25_cov65-Phaeocystis_antarctica.AAC.2
MPFFSDPAARDEMQPAEMQAEGRVTMLKRAQRGARTRNTHTHTHTRTALSPGTPLHISTLRNLR